MKKLLAVLLVVLMLPAASMAEETITANAVAESNTVYQIVAPYSGVLKPFDWEMGDLIGANEVLFEMDTVKAYAPVDGTVRAMFAEAGDQAANVMNQYGMLAAIEKKRPMVINATTSGAYNKEENRIIHVGEDFLTVFLVEFLDDVYGIVSVKIVDELLGDFLSRHAVEKLASVILVKFHQHIGCRLGIKETVQVFSLLQIKILIEVGDIGGVQSFKQLAGCCLVLGGYY